MLPCVCSVIDHSWRQNVVKTKKWNTNCRQVCYWCLTSSVIYYLLRPVLKELHWLPVEQRITFKVLLLTFKALNNLAPPYLSQLIVPYNPTRNLRSASKHLLEVPNVRLKSYGDRAFSVAAPKHWNDIPLDIKLSGSVDVFKSRLKTYLFRLAFDWLFVLVLLLVSCFLFFYCKAI